MAKATTPRYVMPSHGVLTYEFPIVVEGTRKVSATLSVAANDLPTALKLALEWCSVYSAKREYRHFPEIMQHGKHAVVKRIDRIAYAWVEDNLRGAWVPVDRLR